MEKQLEILLKLLSILIERSSYDNAKDISNGTDFIKADGFYLLVGVSGTVQATTINNDSWTKTLPAGMFPIKLKSITGTGTSATNLLACY